MRVHTTILDLTREQLAVPWNYRLSRFLLRLGFFFFFFPPITTSKANGWAGTDNSGDIEVVASLLSCDYYLKSVAEPVCIAHVRFARLREPSATLSVLAPLTCSPTVHAARTSAIRVLPSLREEWQKKKEEEGGGKIYSRLSRSKPSRYLFAIYWRGLDRAARLAQNSNVNGIGKSTRRRGSAGYLIVSRTALVQRYHLFFER